jgi:hypothetical protein
VIIKIVPNERGIPQSKLAEAELVFEEGVLCGLKLVGFGVWEGREGRHITFPSRPFTANGERRSYTVLRPVSDTTAQEPLRQRILKAFIEFEYQAAARLAAPLDAVPRDTVVVDSAVPDNPPTDGASIGHASLDPPTDDAAPDGPGLDSAAPRDAAATEAQRPAS